ncbi:hypothetical protein [Sphingopyxis sp.]|uniref:hypothetical protein n=1 Tax=Sphingopyxis sp. TaxID=1908224 RepID=UPI0026075D07|nr:hypothetical protein [Sphingopyxis sp.]MCW0196618.1 hypothetical protein [Sphingopyxis sp.]
MSNTNPPETATAEQRPVATPPPSEPPEVPRHLRGRKRRDGKRGGCMPWVLGFAVLFALFLVWKLPAFKAQAELGSAYAARVGCSCRYVEGRSLESCQTDFEPGMEMVSLSEDAATKTITGSVPLLASRSARYAGASGCLINPAN